MPNQKIGYARVAIALGNLEHQIECLKSAGCSQHFLDEGKGLEIRERPGFKALLATLQPGMTVVVCDMQRISRSLETVLSIWSELDGQGVRLELLDKEGSEFCARANSSLVQIIASAEQFSARLTEEVTEES